LAAGFAEEVGADFIVGGHNRDDGRVFRDARREFFELFERAMRSASRVLAAKRTKILLPLGEMSKVQVVRKGASLEVPFQLTWSCHRDGRMHCWDCDGCKSRVESFKRAKVTDPLSRPLPGKVS
jgi:7-cyano-7-deazaguanine synthase